MKTLKEKKKASPPLLTNGRHCEPTHDEIALRAYSLWERQGHPQKQEVELWLQAESQLRQPQSQPGIRA